ncbi:hypothetical protein [Acinetobacter sp. ANC 4910]|nr:hypothetical protein [Acinetobacter sp. ANC 4910]
MRTHTSPQKPKSSHHWLHTLQVVIGFSILYFAAIILFAKLFAATL